MSEAAAATAAAPAAPSTTTTAAAPTTAGATLTSLPTGEWLSGFKNEELKSYVQERKFTSPEQMAERYQNLEKLRGVPEDRLLKLPEKMEGDEARAIWERLGAPKEAKGYELPRDEKEPQFAEFAEAIFHQNNLTKTQAHGVAKAWVEFGQKQMLAEAEARKNAISQADVTLQAEWGQHYDMNINLAKQGAKILGLDGKTLDSLEMMQGRETLFKNLQRIGVSVGESNFVTGGAATTTTGPTPEQAQQEIKSLMQDRKFVKKINKGDKEALARWNSLNQAAAPGDKSIG